MASLKCNITGGKGYNSGWDKDWKTDLIEGYAGVSGAGKTYCTVLRIKVPALEDPIESTSLSFVIPFVRPNNAEFAKSGTFYFKIYSSDPTSDDVSDVLPTKDNKDGSISWASTDLAVHKVESSIATTTLEANKTFYLAIGSSEIIQVGDDNTSQGGQDFSFALNYSLAYTNGSAPSIFITDNKNNTITISGALGKNGTNNTIRNAAVYYTEDGSDPYIDGSDKYNEANRVYYRTTKDDDDNPTPSSGESYSVTIGIASSGTIKAVVRCAFEHNLTYTSASQSVKYYANLGKPGKPALTDSSYKNGRLTVKNPWTFIWTPTVIQESTLKVAGYEYALMRKPIDKDMWGSPVIGTYENGTAIATTSITFNDPAALGFKAGDKIMLLIQAYAIDGNNNTIYSDAVKSIEYTVQNAGIVNVKVDGNWKEGQVYVKVNNEWKEAETVNVKVNGAWQESQ